MIWNALRERVPMGLRTRIADLRGRGLYEGYPNRHRCIFIHIPKTAGSSIALALFGEESRHIPYTEYMSVSPGKFRRYFKFAFVRNPWDRLVSSYFYLRAGGMNEMDRKWAETTLASFPDFTSFVRGWVNEDNIRSFVHFLPQEHFVCDENGRVMVDFLGRFENLSHDFNEVAGKLNVEARLARVNEGRHAPFGSYYDAETREIVARVYARDVALFHYTFSA